MNVEAVAASICAAAERGDYYPAEWSGKLSLDDGDAVQLATLARLQRVGEERCAVTGADQCAEDAQAARTQHGEHGGMHGQVPRQEARLRRA